jgi:hypothetical protein
MRDVFDFCKRHKIEALAQGWSPPFLLFGLR